MVTYIDCVYASLHAHVYITHDIICTIIQTFIIQNDIIQKLSFICKRIEFDTLNKRFNIAYVYHSWHNLHNT